LGVVAIWHNLLPEAKEEFYEWHNREHMPERAGIPGFHRGRRFIALEGEPEFFNLYEADSVEVLGGQDYLNRLNTPTPWTRQVVASFRDVSRSILRIAYTGGVGQGGVMLTQRFDLPAEERPKGVELLSQMVFPKVIAQTGIAGAHFGLADEAISKVETAEKKARADATLVPNWVVMIEGVSAAHVRKAGALVIDGLAEAGLGTPVDTSIYQLEYARCKTPWSAG
jgi:hypothetical protein